MITPRFRFLVRFVSVISCVLVLGSQRHGDAEPKLQLDILTMSSGKVLGSGRETQSSQAVSSGRVIVHTTAMCVQLYVQHHTTAKHARI